MKKRLFPFLIALSALSVSGSAAFYSVFGLSKLFAGASTQVIIMAGSLEFAKLVVASLLYQYWGTINKWLKGYLMVACFILMVITSGGIYGFLSGAYQETATKSELLDKSLAILNQKQIRFEEQKDDLNIEKTQLNNTISDLRVSLSNPGSVSYYDKEAEQVITTTSSSTRRALQAELKTTIEDRDNVNLKLEAILDSIAATDIALLDKEIGNEEQRELGPLKYLSETTGQDMGVVVNWFLLLIIFVFDPLAIALVVAANFAFAQIKPKQKDKVPSPHYTPQPPLPSVDNLRKKDEEYSEENWDNKVKKMGVNPNSLLNLESLNLTYPEFVEKYYDLEKTPKKEIVKKEEELESPKDIDLSDIENYLNKVDYVNPPPKKYNLKKESELVDELREKENPQADEEMDEPSTELDRLTDTTQTLIVEEDKPEKKDRVLRYDKSRRKGKGKV